MGHSSWVHHVSTATVELPVTPNAEGMLTVPISIGTPPVTLNFSLDSYVTDINVNLNNSMIPPYIPSESQTYVPVVTNLINGTQITGTSFLISSTYNPLIFYQGNVSWEAYLYEVTPLYGQLFLLSNAVHCTNHHATLMLIPTSRIELH